MLAPLIRHPTGGPLKPILERIARRIVNSSGEQVDANMVLMLWVRAQGAVVVTTSGNPDRIRNLGKIAMLPDLLTQAEIEEITAVGKTIHYRNFVSVTFIRRRYPYHKFFQTEHMGNDSPLPNLAGERTCEDPGRVNLNGIA